MESIPQFDPSDSDNISKRWDSWLKGLDALLRYKGIIDDSKRVGALLLHGGPEIRDIYDAEIKMAPEEKFEEIVKKFATKFKPIVNIQMNIYNFQMVSQEEDEKFDEFVSRLRTKAAICEFGTTLESRMISQIIQKCSSSKLREDALSNESIKLEELIRLGRMQETVKKQAILMSNKSIQNQEENLQSNVNKITRNPTVREFNNNRNANNANNNFKQLSKQKCYNCGRDYPHVKPNVCPAHGEKCNVCGKLNHFGRYCKSKQSVSSDRRAYSVKSYELNQLQDDLIENDSKNCWRVSSDNKNHTPKALLSLCGSTVECIIDTGAECDIIDENTWSNLLNKPKLTKCRTTLYAYGTTNPIKVVGEFTSVVNYQNSSAIHNKFIVTSNSCGNLISYDTAKLLNIDFNNLTTKPKLVNTIIADHFKDGIINKYPKLFTDKIGCFLNHSIKFHINPAIKPVYQKVRPIPFHLRTKVEQALLKLQEDDVIEPVYGPTPWLSPVVPVPKKDTSDIRICTDQRASNQAIERERYQMKTEHDLITSLSNAKFMSRLDLKAAFNQFEIAEESRYITAFCTHIGVFRYKRLNNGINNGSEYCQRALEELLSGLKQQIVMTDDISVWGDNEDEHDFNLNRVLERLEASGLTLNKAKVHLKKTELEFYGLHFSADGLKVQESKSDAILNASVPKDAKELRSFLGLANYCSRFIKNFASLAEPLRELTKKNIHWNWKPTHQKAFDEIKAALSTDAMAYFDPKLRTEITIDASPVGLACVMAQYDPKQKIKPEKKIISFNSRTLSDVEKRYSQTEKEALGLVWACEKLHLYLVGSEFDVITDNKAVELIFNNPYSTPKARIERWCLRLMPFNFKVIHKPGFENIADYLSRNPMKSKSVDDNETIAELYVNAITNASIPSAISEEKLIKETNEDKTLIEIKKFIRNGKFNPNVQYFNNYSKIRNELSIATNGLVLKNTKIVVPSSLHKQIVSIAHSGHQGIVQTKQLIRAHVWFPNIDSLTEIAVKSCQKCQVNTDTTRINPLSMTEMPDGPWQIVATDFFGPMPHNIYLLVLIDLYSRYPIVKKITSTAARSVIPTLDDIFAHYGIPIKLKSDNGPPFKSREFREFAAFLGFLHERITPYWPRANGSAERFMQSLNKVIKINGLINKNWEADLVEFLRNYRSTPNSTTKVAPMQLLFQTNSSTSRLPIKRHNNFNSNLHLEAKENDRKSKSIMKKNADIHLKTVQHSFKLNDYVLLKQLKVNKQTPLFDPNPFSIVNIKGSMITIERNGVQYARNSSLLKLFIKEPNTQHTKINNSVNFKAKNDNPQWIQCILDEEESNAERDERVTPPPTPHSPLPQHSINEPLLQQQIEQQDQQQIAQQYQQQIEQQDQQQLEQLDQQQLQQTNEPENNDLSERTDNLAESNESNFVQIKSGMVNRTTSLIEDFQTNNSNVKSPIHEAILGDYNLEALFDQTETARNTSDSKTQQVVKDSIKTKNENNQSLNSDSSFNDILEQSLNDSNIDYSSAIDKTLLESPAVSKRVRKQTQFYGNPISTKAHKAASDK